MSLNAISKINHFHCQAGWSQKPFISANLKAMSLHPVFMINCQVGWSQKRHEEQAYTRAKQRKQ